MNSVRSRPAAGLAKVPTGIAGFDQITGGGLPRGRTTLLVGGPGSGKTILALQFLVHGAKNCDEPGIFVAFEESSKRIVGNAASFGWNLPELRRKKLFFMDAQPNPDLIQSGDFDLSGMCAALEAQIRKMRARRIVFDALDVILALLPSREARRREIYRLHEWLLSCELTGIISLESIADAEGSMSQHPASAMQFMMDCVVILNHKTVSGVSQRNLRVQKYRGSGFDEDETPFLIGAGGFEVPVVRSLGRAEAKGSNERISSGIKRLDTMLGGGYYRGACVLITGFSGTAKTTLSGAFAEAACRRGEHTMFVTFDSNGVEVIRNLASVGIRLDRYVKSGRLRMISARTIAGSAETYLTRIKTFAKQHKARCLVVDPVSIWSKSGHDPNAQNSVAERLIDWSKGDGITLVCTKLLDEVSSAQNDSPPQVSMLADTWIHLNHLVQDGERNRSLAIIKSRGTAHSNQMRELILSHSGVTLADAYTARGDVLMGTLRWEKEHEGAAANTAAEVTGKLRRGRLDAEEAALDTQLKSLQVARVVNQRQKALLARAAQSRESELSRGRTHVRELRGVDPTMPRRK